MRLWLLLLLALLGMIAAGSLGYNLKATENSMHWGSCPVGPGWETRVWPMELSFDGTLTVRTGYAIDGVMIRRVVKK